jgi:hypothetical protein
MNLLRLHAYEVTPQRLAKTHVPPRGGAFSAPTSFKAALEDFISESKLDEQPSVDFRPAHDTSSSSRMNTVRDLIISYCFDQPSTAKRSAIDLAKRLGESMDDRSAFTLLLLAAYQESNRRRLVLWAFPKDEPFYFKATGDRATIRILKNAFSRNSTFRKAALYEGERDTSSFWSGRVIDKYHQSGFSGAADYWVSMFLDSRSSLAGPSGTRLLAKCLRQVYDASESHDEREQLSDSIIALRASNRTNWTMRSVANNFLSGEVKEKFLEVVPDETKTTPFKIQKEEFEDKLNFRIFRLANDVRVSAPFGVIGSSVKISGGKQPTLSCRGKIVAEKLRAKHA